MGQHQSYDKRRQQIISGALKAFSEKGYLGASNRDIARAAGLNSAALIYHYFDNKKALFQAVVQESLPPIQMADQADFLKVQPVEEALTLIGMTIVQALSQAKAQALIRLMLAEALRESDVAIMVYEGGSTHILAFLYDYFEHLMQTGVIRQGDLGATVRCFLGPLTTYFLMDKLLALPDEHVPEAKLLVETAVHIFLTGTAS